MSHDIKKNNNIIIINSNNIYIYTHISKLPPGGLYRIHLGSLLKVRLHRPHMRSVGHGSYLGEGKFDLVSCLLVGSWTI